MVVLVSTFGIADIEDHEYDGKAHTWLQYDVTGLVGTDSIEAVVTGSISSVSGIQSRTELANPMLKVRR